MFCYKYLKMIQISNSLCFRHFLLRASPTLRWQINNFFVNSAYELQDNPQTLKNTITTKEKKTSKSTYLIPPLSKQDISAIETMTAISVGFQTITWIKFAIDTLTVLDWNGKPLPENFFTALHEPSLLSVALNTKRSLPASDLFVMETFSMNFKQWERNINEVQLLSMLIVLIHGIVEDQESKMKVVFQQKKVLDKVFGICLGLERISTSSLTESILQEANSTDYQLHSITAENFNSALKINSKLIDSFNSSNFKKKEDLSLAFLLALSFIQVHILKIKNIKLSKKN